MLLLNGPFISPDLISEIFFPSTHHDKRNTHRIEDFNKEEPESLIKNSGLFCPPSILRTIKSV